MARIKERGQLVGDIYWYTEQHEVAIRMFERSVFLMIRGEVARPGVIRDNNQTAHLLNMRKFRVNERDRRGRITTFYGCVLRKQIDGVWYDLAMETEDFNDGCKNLVLREHRPWTGYPDERYFILHRESDNTHAIESFIHHNCFLKVDQDANALCMVNIHRDSLIVRDGFHPFYKFEIFFDPPSVHFPDSDYPEVINYIYRQKLVDVIEEQKTETFTFKKIFRIFTCRP